MIKRLIMQGTGRDLNTGFLKPIVSLGESLEAPAETISLITCNNKNLNLSRGF